MQVGTEPKIKNVWQLPMNQNRPQTIGPSDPVPLDNDGIYARIFEAIVDHKVNPGTHLKEDELCSVFNVGRTRMRAVLSRLTADHIVEQVANRGVFVSRPSAKEAREVFRARRLVEGHLIRRAAENPTPELQKALGNHLCQEKAARDSGITSAVIKRCGNYHQVLADQADSPIVARFVRELIARSALIVAIYEAAAPDERELDEHNLLTDLIHLGRADEAAELMETHLLGIENRLDLTPKRDIRSSLRESLEGG